jgi:transaldolase
MTFASGKYKTKIYLDGADSLETRDLLHTFGMLDGQTTDPSFLARNPVIKERLRIGEKLTKEELLLFYKKIVQEMAREIGGDSISIEVYADKDTTAEEMFEQAWSMNTWTENAHIKLPITKEGIKAAGLCIRANIRVNMTLCFSEAQAAAVYSATMGAPRGSVYLSIFIGRLDDTGYNGIDLVRNISALFSGGDRHVLIVCASIRKSDHIRACLRLGADIITAPSRVLLEWHRGGRTVHPNWQYDDSNLFAMEKENVILGRDWHDQDIKHKLTDRGLERFAEDWKNLLKE